MWTLSVTPISDGCNGQYSLPPIVGQSLVKRRGVSLLENCSFSKNGEVIGLAVFGKTYVATFSCDCSNELCWASFVFCWEQWRLRMGSGWRQLPT
jgi:hypothetical protein